MERQAETHRERQTETQRARQRETQGETEKRRETAAGWGGVSGGWRWRGGRQDRPPVCVQIIYRITCRWYWKSENRSRGYSIHFSSRLLLPNSRQGKN